MLFIVNVPVLSDKILLAPPIVSHEDKFLTKLFSYLILFIEKAKAIVTSKYNVILANVLIITT
jgi:hypothetical protein